MYLIRLIKLKSKQPPFVLLKLKNTQTDFANFLSAFDGEDGKIWILNLKTGHNARRIFLSSVIIHKSSHEPLLWTEEGYWGPTANTGLPYYSTVSLTKDSYRYGWSTPSETSRDIKKSFLYYLNIFKSCIDF